MPLFRQKKARELSVRIGGFGRVLHRLSVVVFGLVGVSLHGVNGRKVGVGRGGLGESRNQHFQILGRLLQFSLVHVQGGEVRHAFRVQRVKPQGFLNGRHRLIQAALGLEDERQVGVEVVNLGVLSDGPGNEIKSLIVLRSLVGDDPEEVERFEVIGLDLHDPAVERFGLVNMARPMVQKRLLEKPGNVFIPLRGGFRGWPCGRFPFREDIDMARIGSPLVCPQDDFLAAEDGYPVLGRKAFDVGPRVGEPTRRPKEESLTLEGLGGKGEQPAIPERPGERREDGAKISHVNKYIGR